jgi:hypothetical protein
MISPSRAWNSLAYPFCADSYTNEVLLVSDTFNCHLKSCYHAIVALENDQRESNQSRQDLLYAALP